jgi:microcystin-dependent protein
MLVTNLTSHDIYFGPLHLPAGIGQQITVDDTTDTSLYLSNDFVADALNNAFNAGAVTVSGQSLPFPRPTGTPELVHGDGSPEGLVYSSRGSVYMRRDAAVTWVLYVKTTEVTQSTGWVAVDTTGMMVPTGAIISFGGVTPPSGWLACDGTAYAQGTYAALFAALVVNKTPLPGPYVTVTIASPAVFTLSGHGLIAGDTVYLETTGALPTGLSPDTPYYVIAAGLTANNFELSASRGGSAINTSGSQSGSHSLYYAPYANANMSAGSFTVPDLRGRVPVGYSGSGGANAVAPLGNNDGRSVTVRSISHRHTLGPWNTQASGTGTQAPELANSIDNHTQTSPNTTGDGNNQDFPAYLTVSHIIKI